MKIGLLAGNRNFPLLFAQEFRKKNPSCELVICALRGEANPALCQYAHKFYWVMPTNLGDVIAIFHKENITQAFMAGQVSPWRIFRHQNNWDALLKKVMMHTADIRPHSVFTAILDEFKSQGIVFLDSTQFLKEYLTVQGVMNQIVLGNAIEQDISCALKIAQDIVNLDIGQTVVVKDKAVVAVEALEGTDAAIRRAARICGKGFMVLKLSRKNQDMRFDVPIVGFNTVKLLAKLSARALVLEQGKVLILDKERFLSYANRARISIVGVCLK